MYKNRTIFIGLLMVLSSYFCHAQNNVSVNTFNGSANVTIPFYTITSGNVSAPVGISYSTSGVKPKDMEGTVGIGWNLVAGGSIRRVVRGLPDDLKKDSLGNTLLGWMYNSNQATISGHTFTNNGSTCSNETADISFITSNFSNLYDTEPDLFYVSAPGLSLKMVYDQSIGKFRTIPYQDVVITYTTDAATGLITSFTIVNDKGIKYLFTYPEKVVESTDLTGNAGGVVNYFMNKYLQYKNTIRYNDVWNLSSINDATIQYIGFKDTAICVRHSTDKVNLYIAGSSSAALQYNIHRTVYPQLPVNMTTANTAENQKEVTFRWTSYQDKAGQGNSLAYLSSIMGQGDTISFVCDSVTYTNGSHTANRMFLHSIYDKGCGSPVNYSFSYAGETYNSGTNTYSTTLSDSASKKWDYWGYNSSVKDSIPAIYVDPSSSAGYPRYTIAAAGSGGTNYLYTVGYTGSSMAADTNNVAAGALTKITYALGGTTTINYQSNDYVDVPSGALVKGDGIRVKQVIDYDGLDNTKNVIHNYSYTNSGVSSGKPVSQPAYAFTIPYTGSATGQALWAYSTAISDVDLSPENHSIVYQYCKESQTNAGSTLYQYYLPATNWDTSAAPDCSGCATEWVPTYDYMGRTSCTASYGQVKNDYYGYPFIPNPNYDFERGVLKQVTTYTDAGTEVSETDYTYQRSYGTPASIPAFKFDYNTGTTGVMGYNKYSILASTSELTTQVTKKVYDSPTLSQYQQSAVNYTYGSANHKLVTKETVTNSDNSILISNINYTKDFVADSGSNANVLALYKLQKQNINVPVETWSQVQIGSTTYTTKAALTLFALAQPVNSYNSYYLPSRSYVFLSPDGVTNFTPFSVSGQTTTKYSGYPSVPAANYTYYDNVGSLQTTDDGHHHKNTSVMDYDSQSPALNATNTAANCLAFNDFDSDIVPPFNYWTISGTPTFVNNGHTGKAAVFTTSQTFSVSAIAKDSLANNYIFSVWVNSGSVSGTLALTITPVSGTPGTYTESFPATGNAWKYFEWKVPVSSFNGNFSASIALTGGTIDIDDILLYPETSEVSTYGHDPQTHFANATTNTNGVTTYYQVDKWGRLAYAYDRDHNILKKNTYVFPKDITGFTGAGTLTAYSSTNTFDTDAGIYFSTTDQSPCDGSATTYTWDFGDGTKTVTTSYLSPQHFYPDSGTYTAKLTISSPVFGSFTSSTTVHLVPGPMNISYYSYAIGHGTISKIDLYHPDGTLAYEAVPSQFSTTHPLKEIYRCVVTMTTNSYQYISSTGQGYASVGTQGDNNTWCLNYASSNSYTFTLDLRQCNSLTFVVQTTTCTGGGGGI